MAWNAATPPNVLAGLARDPNADVRHGVAGNTATPPGVLAGLAHDLDTSVRRGVAGNTAAPSGVLAGLAHDLDASVRRSVVWNAATPPDGLAGLAHDPDVAVRRQASWNAAAPPEVLATLARDLNAEVRRGVAGNAAVPPEVLAGLARDPDADVRRAANKAVPPEVLAALARDPDADVRCSVAGSAATAPEVLAALARDPDASVRRAVAGNAAAAPEVLAALARDPDASVRRAYRDSRPVGMSGPDASVRRARQSGYFAPDPSRDGDPFGFVHGELQSLGKTDTRGGGVFNSGGLVGSAGRHPQSRVIDANLYAERFIPGETATLTVVVRLPGSHVRGKWQGEALIDGAQGPVRVLLEAKGFTLLSELPPPVKVPEDRDATPAAFELRIDEANERWLHIMLTQEGRPVGELTITDFSAVGQAAAQLTASSPFRSVAEADLMLVVRASDRRIEACSPRERASLDHVAMTGFHYPETLFRELLAGRLRALYDNRSDAEETARELQLVGVELACCLPTDLIKLLRRPDIRSVMLRHEDDFDFPLELCYLDDPEDPFFVGDRIAVYRWYLGLTSLPDVVAKPIRKVAFLRGDDAAATADEALLNRLYPGRTVTFTKHSEIREKLFKTAEFDLIHFTGHCRQRDGASGGLELADGNHLRLIEVGQLEAERAFAAAQPFVMLNACASAQPYLGLTRRGSFAHRFVNSRACAVVGTLWPVAGAVANEFVARFYAELADKPIGQALLAAKLALVRASADGNEADDATPLHRLARQVAVRSYCLFANPDLRLMAWDGCTRERSDG